MSAHGLFTDQQWKIYNWMIEWGDAEHIAKELGIVQVHGFYYFEKEHRISVDVVPDISVHDEAALSSQLANEIKALVPEEEVTIVIDHNYSE